jgi:hypothetical protein
MDDEATTVYPTSYGTRPAGLHQYHKHFQRTFGGSVRCEPSWSQRIRTILCNQGMSVRAEVRYPEYSASYQKKKRMWCDLCIDLDSGERLWIEVKGSWPVWFNRSDGQNTAYLWKTYHPYLFTDTAADFGKLSTLKRPDAHWIGVLLIGFDTPLLRLDSEVEAMVRETAPTWAPLVFPEWEEPHYGTRAKVWLWYTSVSCESPSHV